MSDASRTQLIYSAESVYDEVPSTPAMKRLRITKPDINPANSTVVSDELRADAMRSDLLLVGINTAGTFESEFSYLAFDDMLEALLRGTWTTTGDATFANGVSTIATTTFTSATAAFVSGDIGKVLTNANFPAGTYIVSINSGTSVELSNPATASGTALSFTIKARSGTGNVLQNGITDRSFLFEQGHLDIGQYFQYRGTVIGSLDLDITAKAIIKAVFGVTGSRATRSGTTVAASVAEPPSFPPITSGTSITGLDANTNMTNIKVKSLKIKIDNGLRMREHIASIATDDPGRGVQEITGTIEAYFKNGALFDQFVANTATAFNFVVTDPLSGRSYTIQFPKVKLTDSTRNIPGIDSDGMETIGFRALFDPITSKQIKILRT